MSTRRRSFQRISKRLSSVVASTTTSLRWRCGAAAEPTWLDGEASHWCSASRDRSLRSSVLSTGKQRAIEKDTLARDEARLKRTNNGGPGGGQIADSEAERVAVSGVGTDVARAPLGSTRKRFKAPRLADTPVQRNCRCLWKTQRCRVSDKHRNGQHTSSAENVSVRPSEAACESHSRKTHDTARYINRRRMDVQLFWTR